MGSQITLFLQLEDQKAANHYFERVVTIFAEAEQRMSRFLPTSELSEINGRSGEWVTVSEPMWDVINKALALAHETDGLFDPTLLNAIEQIGYRQSFEQLDPLQNEQPVTEHLPSSGQFRAIQLKPASFAIKLPRHVRLDLGGIGKGYTAQKAVRYLTQFGPCLIDAGGDITAGDAPAELPGWPTGIAAPGKGEQPELCRLWLANSTLATSGVDYRRWRHNGRQNHHIIDPQTAVSAQTDLLTASVIAEDACVAEAWATATLIVGAEAGLEMLTAVDLQAALIDNRHQFHVTPQLAPHIQYQPAED
jgi:thiamine biosynthesis lipoprotein